MPSELSVEDARKVARASSLLQNLVDVVFGDDERKSDFSAIGVGETPAPRRRASRRGKNSGTRKRSRK